MQCQSWARSGDRVHLCGVAEFLLNAGSGSRLNELSKARSRIGESPGRKLDRKSVESFPNDFHRFVVHNKVSIPLRKTLKIPSNLTAITAICPYKLTREDLLGPGGNRFC